MEEGKYNHGATKMAEVINEKKTKAKNWISDIVLPVQSDDVEEEKNDEETSDDEIGETGEDDEAED